MRVCTVCQEPVPAGMPVCPRDGGAAEDPDDGGDRVIGSMIGEYKVKGVIGEGGMGQVYEGLQPVIGKRVAIKLLRRELATDKVEAQRLLAEARTVNAIGHRGIIDIFSFGALPDGRQYFVMEYLSGVSLSQHIRTYGALPLEDTLKLLDEMLAALGAAHGAGVIHRDFKPSNIFLVAQPDGSSFVKLLDFGIAKQAAYARGETPQTRVSRIMGTPEYMAPEQARGQAVGPRTDLYALGVVAFEMLTGQLPFDADNPFEIVNMHLNRQPTAPSALVMDVPAEVDSLVLRLLQKTPQDRPPSAEVVREEIKRIRRALNLHATQLMLAPASMTRAVLKPVTGETREAPMSTTLTEPEGREPTSALEPIVVTRDLGATSMSGEATRIVETPISAELDARAVRKKPIGVVVGGVALVAVVGGIIWWVARGERADSVAVRGDTHAGDARAADTHADPRTADPRTADPRTADPRTADTRTADPRTADPRTADPRTADPRTADTRTADARTDTRAADARATDSRTAVDARAAELKPPVVREEPERAKPRVDALTARYKRIQSAWTKSRGSRTPEDRRIFDVMLSEVGKQLAAGSRSDATESLNDFVQGALGGREP